MRSTTFFQIIAFLITFSAIESKLKSNSSKFCSGLILSSFADEPSKPSHQNIPKKRDNNGIWQMSRTFSIFAEEKNSQIFQLSRPGTFIGVWYPDNPPKKILWLLHGTGGSVYDEIKDELTDAKKYGYALVALQWRIENDYLRPNEIYPLIEESKSILEHEFHWDIKVNALLGFSRGSASSFELAAIDAEHGKLFKYFILISGGAPLNAVVAKNKPDSRDIFFQKFNQHLLSPSLLKGIQFWLYSGRNDEQWGPEMSKQMANGKAGIEAAGGTVIEWVDDPNSGHMGPKKNRTLHQRAIEPFVKM